MQGKEEQGAARRCVVESCMNRAHRGALCTRHHDDQRLAGVACADPTCEQQAKRRGLCGRHYRAFLSGRAECSIDGCSNAVYSKGICQTHWRRLRFAGTVCVVAGCEREQVNKGLALCAWHYDEHRLAGRLCSFTGCGRPLKVAGLCRGHYRQRQLGRELQPIPHRRAPGEGSINRLGYREITVAPNVRRLEHRAVMEAILGRELAPHEHVHHRNGDRLDNRPENLELWNTGQPNGQRVADLLDSLARDYPVMYLIRALGIVSALETHHERGP